MKRTLAAIGISLALALPAVAVPAMAAEEDAATPDISLLYAFQGNDVKVKAVPGQRGNFTMTMPVRGPKQPVTWFTDRPVRGAGHIPMDEFVSLWNVEVEDGFKADPPNVALSFGDKVAIATMTNPRLRTNKNGTTSLVANMSLVKGEVLTALTAQDGGFSGFLESSQGVTLPKSATLPSVSVFVDDYMSCTHDSMMYKCVNGHYQ